MPSRKKAKKGAPQVTPDGLQHELLGRQLNMAQTKITSLDSQLSEMQKKNLILETRIKLFEDKENTGLYNNYFAQGNTQAVCRLYGKQQDVDALWHSSRPRVVRLDQLYHGQLLILA